MALSPDEIQEVYDAAQSLRPAAAAFARRYKLAPVVAEDLIMEAADKVLDAKGQRPGTIENLPAYLFATYKNLLLAFARNAEKEQSLTDAPWELPDRTDTAQEIERSILVEEVVRHMDPQSRFIFHHRNLNYSYEEIVSLYNKEFGVRVEANALRSKYSKALDRLLTKFSDEKHK